MNQLIEVSVIVPNYNYGPYIEECLLSIIESDFDHSTLEIIVVDDASTDNSVNVVNKIIKTTDIPLKLIIHSFNSGLVKTRNTGIVNSRGKYLFFLDSDDYIRKDCLKKHHDFLRNNTYFTACYAPIQKFDNETKENLTIISNEPYDYRKLALGNYIGAIAMIKKEDLVEIGLYDEHMPCNGCEDWELWLRMGYTHKYIYYIDEEPLSYYRVHSSSMLNTLSTSNKVILAKYIRTKYDLSELENNSVPKLAPLLHEISVQIFYSHVKFDFIENKSFIKEIKLLNLPSRVTFNFPPNNESYNFLRFDLANKSGFINIHEIKIRNVEGEVLWKWDKSTIEHKENLFLFQNEELWGDTTVQLSTWIDPQFYVSTNEAVQEQSSRGISVEVSLSSLSSMQYESMNNSKTPFSCISEKQFKDIQIRNKILENTEEINIQIRQTLKTGELLAEQLINDKKHLLSDISLKDDVINKLFHEKEKNETIITSNEQTIYKLQEDNKSKECRIIEMADSIIEAQNINKEFKIKSSYLFNTAKLLEEEIIQVKYKNNKLLNEQDKISKELEKQLNWYKATYENRRVLGIIKDVILGVLKKIKKNNYNKETTVKDNFQNSAKPPRSTIKSSNSTSLSDIEGNTLNPQTKLSFDEEYYLTTYPDIKSTKLDPYIHYMNTGWKEGRMPNSWFNPTLYLEANPDVKEVNEEPLTHYLRIGKKEGRNVGKTKMQSYFAYLNQNNLGNRYNNDYVELKKYDKIDSDLKFIAFYLPQYHPIPENNEAWGNGFTEWTNVSKALPQFEGHYQPRLPGELGYYDLRLIDIQKRQIELATNYGIYGFCYHYYWFAGKKVMDKPLQQIIENPDLDFPFCINWANENWTKKWDGLDDEVILKQNHSAKDDIDFLEAIRPILLDKRYIKINNKPLLMIYRPQLFPDIKATVKRWRIHAKSIGIGDIYLVLTHSFDSQDPREIGFDAATEFAPNGFPAKNITTSLKTYNPNFNGTVYDYYSVINYSSKCAEHEYTKFRGICPGWDNEARKPGNATVFYNSTPTLYKRWLEFLCFNTEKYRSSNEKIIFINAWNEWGEGAYLEPDKKYGYAYLESTHNVLKKFDKRKLELLKGTQSIRKDSDTAVILHLYYVDLWTEIKNELNNFKEPFDLYVSINNNTSIEEINNIKEVYPNANIYSYENRGRDILPFLKILELLLPLNYRYICKLHSKKSLHREDGEQWRKSLVQGLIGSPEKIKQSIEYLNKQDVGIVVANGNVYSYKDWFGSNTEAVETLAQKANIEIPEDFMFPAGSMFWFNPKIFEGAEKLLDSYQFPIENGQLDGTTAHAYERIIGLLCAVHNYKIVCI